MMNPPSDTTMVDLAEPAPEPAPVEEAAVSDLVEPEAAGDGLPKRAKREEDGSVTLTLAFPVTIPVKGVDGTVRRQEFRELKMGRLKGAHRKQLQGKATDMVTIAAAAFSTGLALPLMNALYENMDGEDAAAVDMIVGHFFGVGLPTGR